MGFENSACSSRSMLVKRAPPTRVRTGKWGAWRNRLPATSALIGARGLTASTGRAPMTTAVYGRKSSDEQRLTVNFLLALADDSA